MRTSDADAWSDDHEAAVEAERRRLAHWALGWTWLLSFAVAVAVTALIVWGVLHLPAGV